MQICALCLAIVLLSSLFVRHWYGLLLGIASVLFAAHAMFMLGTFARAPAPDAVTALRLLSINIFDDAAGDAALKQTIEEADADVLVMTTTGSLVGRRDLMRQSYPFRVGCDDSNNSRCSVMLLARRPLSDIRFQQLSPVGSELIAATLSIEGRRVRVFATRLSKTWFDTFHSFELFNITRILRATNEPVLLAGDFSAPVIVADMRWFLGNNRLSSVYPEPATWPAWLGPLGVSNDHVFFKAPLSVLSVNRTDRTGRSGYVSLISNIAIKLK
ncbi:endonuclease/exonuclease/phosphatase family protein [Rhizobium viscosum]|uniref:endonuclease/exonuclease/phosphatase family protein n=1 Tax=Rhizobium viscosum TaxID=1673 RepID=UPI00366CCD1E